MKIFRKPGIGCLSVLLFCLMISPRSALADEKSTAPEKAALVNGAVITKKQLDDRLNGLRVMSAQRGQPLTDTQMKQAKKKILNDLINEELLYQYTQTQGMKISDQEVQEYLSQVKSRYPGDDQYKKALSQLGFSEGDLELQIARNLAIRRLIETEIARKISISEKEKKEYYASNPNRFGRSYQIKARHILIKSNPEDDKAKKAKARKKIEQIRQRVKKGEDFAALARELSEGPSAVNGGDLGYFGRGQMVPPFEKAAFALDVNEISPVVETRFGYHIIKVEDKKEPGTIPYEEAEKAIAKQLYMQEMEVRFQRYIKQLKQLAVIQKFQ